MPEESQDKRIRKPKFERGQERKLKRKGKKGKQMQFHLKCWVISTRAVSPKSPEGPAASAFFKFTILGSHQNHDGTTIFYENKIFVATQQNFAERFLWILNTNTLDSKKKRYLKTIYCTPDKLFDKIGIKTSLHKHSNVSNEFLTLFSLGLWVPGIPGWV